MIIFVITDSDMAEDSPSHDRDIVVPMRLYKTVTVFSTLIAIISVVLGFLLLDAAVLSLSLIGDLIRFSLNAVWISISPSILQAVFAFTGLGSIGVGAVVYILGTRFRAEGMGKSQEGTTDTSE